MIVNTLIVFGFVTNWICLTTGGRRSWFFKENAWAALPSGEGLWPDDGLGVTKECATVDVLEGVIAGFSGKILFSSPGWGLGTEPKYKFVKL